MIGQRWEGERCDKCESGYWGAECRQRCSYGCNNNECNKDDGTCFCRYSWRGQRCDVCKQGYWGTECQQRCSRGCYNNECNKDGRCFCKTNYWTGQKWAGEKCDRCESGYWGAECEQRCSRGCNNVCDKEGRCSCKNKYWTGFRWTEAKWKGEKCDKCIQGYWGTECRQRCSPGCNTSECRKEDGACSFKPGWTGERCQNSMYIHVYFQKIISYLVLLLYHFFMNRIKW